MNRAECMAIWKAARAGDDVKLKKLTTDAPDDVARNQINWKHHRKGTTPLMVAAEGSRGEPAVTQLLAAGADVNAVDNTKLKNTALHYAAMTNKDSLTTEALLNAGADPYALNRKGHTPLDVARQHRRSEVGAVLLQHMRVHSDWLYVRGKFLWKRRWGVVVACNKQRTSTELCVYKHPGDLRPEAVLLVDEAARMSLFDSNDSYCWLKRENAFVFDRPVMVQRVKRQKFTRAPICHKTMSHEDVQTRHLVLAADSYNHLARWRRVLQSANFYARESGEPLFEIPAGEFYYWPQELVDNVRKSVIREQEEQREEANDPLFQQLRSNLRRLSQNPPEEQAPAAPASTQKMVETYQPDRAATPHRDRRVGFSDRTISGSGSSEEDFATAAEAHTHDPRGQEHEQAEEQEPRGQEHEQLQEHEQDEERHSTASAHDDDEEAEQPAAALSQQEEEEKENLCRLCVAEPRNAVCAPCGHRAGCHSCLRNVMHTSRSCPICRARVSSIMKVYD